MSPVTSTAVVPLTRQHPHVDQIADFNAQQSTRLLWERIFALQEQLTAAQATITSLVSGHNTNETNITTATRHATAALAQAAASQAAADTAGGAGAGGLPGGGDKGKFQEGIDAGLPTGHDSGGLLTAVRGGQILGGVSNEFIALRNPTATVDARLVNAEELLMRIIWHLLQAGFTVGKQRNPSGLLSRDKLAIEVDAVLRVYDIFVSFDDNTIQLQVAGNEVPLPVLVAEAGTPDS
jgi:hypothetical protein